ncbi:MAG: sigma-70 family RNA polymerase sigma factor [Lachnospiraceae bacterium]|nr:sigma-70 family RNA polymerase sigma factor [Lachnospiraceae bacterium]
MKSSDKLTESVKKFQKGDKAAFEKVYSLSYPYLYTCVIHVVKDADVAQDMIQETYLEICRNIGQLQKAENFLSWASVIANRKCFAAVKKRNAEILVRDHTLDEQTIGENIAENEEFIPESLMENKDKQRMLMEIIDGLTDMQRLCVIGFYYSELSLEEISNALDIPVNTVKSHLSRAKAKIKEAVVELDEKKGIKLYSLAPFMLLLLGTEAEACSAPAMSEELVKELGIDSIGNSGVNASGKAGGKLAGGKIYGIAAVAGVIVVAGIAGIMISHRSAEKLQESQSEQTAEAQDVESQETELQQDTAEAQSETEVQNETQEQEEFELRELFVLDDVYENYGNAYGGSIPVKKDGLWGAINYDNEVIVPFEYDGFYAAGDKLGNFILYKSTITEETYDLSELGLEPNTVTYETREYYLFDNQGNILYQGEDEVSASGGMYITLTENDDGLTSCITYHSLDGTELVSEVVSFENARINGFYDGISNFYCSYGTDIYVDMGGADGMGPFEDDVIPRIATVDLQGNLTWREDPYYYIWWDRINASITRSMESSAARGESGVIVNGAAASSFIGNALLSTMNHGYYVTGSKYIEPGYISMYSENGDDIANIDFFHLAVEGNDAVTNNSGIFNEESYYRGYFVDGATFYNYGSNMVFVVDGKNILVDFSKNSDPGNKTEDLNISEVVTAVYDYIAMADEEYWLVRSDDRWGYIDHDGNEMAMFDDAGGFSNGHALVLEDGEAWFIDADFNKLENLGAADSVVSMGELFLVTIGDEKHIYQYR